MPYKLGGKKPQMNNDSSIKTNAAMYASKTSMYKPMLAPEDEKPREPTTLEQLDVMEGMQKMANDPRRRKPTSEYKPGVEQNLTGEFLTDLEKRKKGFKKAAVKVGNVAGSEFVSDQKTGKPKSRVEIKAKEVAKRKVKEVAKAAGAPASDFPVLTKQLGKESASYARGKVGRIKEAEEKKKKEAAKTKPGMYKKKK